MRLTADFELALDQCKRSLSLMKNSPAAGWSVGAWVIYHLDHWILNFYAWLDRLDALISKVCRVLIRPRSGQWDQIQNRLRPGVDEMRSMVAKLRHPLAHTGAGGATEGIDQERLWEPGLVVGFDEDLAPYYYESVGQFQKRWHDLAFETTAIGLAKSEAMFGELNQKLGDEK